MRTVEWGSIEESYRLTEYIFGPCAADGTAVRDMGRGGGSYDYDRDQAWQLVDGAFGTEVAADDSCWSVTRDVTWIGA